jgi:broad specificity phosphatase PhoE
LVTGRRPDTALTLTGKRQARALVMFLKSQRVRFNAVYSSMAVSICQVISNCAFNNA